MRSAQRGFGALTVLVALLLAMIFVAVALRQYMPAETPAKAAAAPSKDGAAAPVPPDAAPKPAIDRARGLEDTLREQAQEMQERIDQADR